MPEETIAVTLGNNSTQNLRVWRHPDNTIGIIAEESGARLEEARTNADAVSNVITFGEAIMAIEIWHGASTNQTFLVNGISIIVPPGGYSRPIGGVPGTTVTIPAGLTCIVNRLV